MLRGLRNEHLTLKRVPDGEPDVLLAVRVDVGSYGAGDEFWVRDPDWTRFVEGMVALEGNRHGAVRLEGFDAREFWLVFEITDPLGHMTVSGSMTHYGNGIQMQRLAFCFAFDPGLFGDFVRRLGDL